MKTKNLAGVIFSLFMAYRSNHANAEVLNGYQVVTKENEKEIDYDK